MGEHFQVHGNLDSPLHRLDARVKLPTMLLFVALCSSLTDTRALLSAVLFLIALVWVARIPAVIILRRTLWVLLFSGVMVILFPFIIPGRELFELRVLSFTVSASQEGTCHAVFLSLRVMVAVVSMSLLVASTGFRGIIEALRYFRVPAVFTQLLEFSVRYLFVLADEARRMHMARRARAFAAGGSLADRYTFRKLGQTVGVLFLRSCERGERVYLAMLARGLSGERPEAVTPPPCFKDVGWACGIIAVAACLHVLEVGVDIWSMLLK